MIGAQPMLTYTVFYTYILCHIWNNNAIVMIFIFYFDYIQYVQNKRFGQLLDHYQCEVLLRKHKYKVI